MIIGMDGSRLSGRRTGTEMYSQQLLAALIPLAQARGHRVRVYVREPLPNSALTPDEWVHIQQARLWTHLGLGREIASRPPDALFVPSHVLPLACAWRARPKTVVTIHDVGYRRFPSAHPLRQRLYLELGTWFNARFADAVIADSTATQRDVADFYRIPAGKMSVALLGSPPMTPTTEADVAQVRAKFALPEGQPYVLHVGTLQPRKNLHRLMAALPANMLLVLAGGKGWGGEDLQAEAVRLGSAERVRFTGYIDEREKAALLREAAVYACPSLYEGFGLPVLEAQATGVPVVCSNTSSLPEVAGEAALFFDPRSVEAIAHALVSVLSDAALRQRLIEAGQANVRRFSWERCAEVVLGRIEN